MPFSHTMPGNKILPCEVSIPLAIYTESVQLTIKHQLTWMTSTKSQTTSNRGLTKDEIRQQQQFGYHVCLG